MNLYVCSNCEIEKPETEFYSKNRVCKPCYCKRRQAYGKTLEGAACRKRWRQKVNANPALLEKKRGSQRKYELKPERIEALRIRYNRFRAFLDGYKAFMGCRDCGDYEYKGLEFDHVRGRKDFKVTVNAHFSFAKILREIEKCEVRCNSCHKDRHKREGKPNRTRMAA